MQSAKQAYIVAGVDLASVCNRNETRVAACLRKVLEELGNPTLETKVLQDAFALALNQFWIPPGSRFPDNQHFTATHVFIDIKGL